MVGPGRLEQVFTFSSREDTTFPAPREQFWFTAFSTSCKSIRTEIWVAGEGAPPPSEGSSTELVEVEAWRVRNLLNVGQGSGLKLYTPVAWTRRNPSALPSIAECTARERYLHEWVRA